MCVQLKRELISKDDFIMAITNHDRVGKAMELLKGGLGPFVEREFRSKFKDRTAAETARAAWATTA